MAAGKDDPGRACQLSAYWLPAEQKQWQCYALGMLYAPLRGTLQVLRIEPDGGSARVYRVLTLFRSDSLNPLRSSLTLLTVFAVRSDSGWLFANALPRFTAAWPRETVGPFTYIRPPDQPFQRARAEAAVRFADSVATLFAVPPPAPLTYFVMPTIDDVYRAMGLQTLRKWGPGGGVSQPMNRILFSGDPAIGENYRHELVHIMLRPISGSPLAFVSEAVPTWLGGTSGMDFRTAAQGLATFLRNKPTVTLDSMVDGRYPAPVTYAAGAVFVQMLFEHGGIDAVREFYRSRASGTNLRMHMTEVFQQPWPVIADTWRSRALAFVGAQRGRAAEGPPDYRPQLPERAPLS